MSESRSAPYVAPEYEATAFNCPICNAYAQQDWGYAWSSPGPHGPFRQADPYKFANCSRCKLDSVWCQGVLVYPLVLQTPPPNSDMPEAIKRMYLEAEEVFNRSPRAAAALLRLCVQMICIELGERGERINDDIKSLVAKGLPVPIQRALDTVRIVGNDAVHPGQIDLDDNRELALSMFALVNMIVANRISEPKRIAELYETLPQPKRDQVERRDDKAILRAAQE